MLGTYVLRAGYYEAYYGRALRARRKIYDDFQAAFTKCDVLATATSPIPAFRFGERMGKDYTLFALTSGEVKFAKSGKRTIVSIIPGEVVAA